MTATIKLRRGTASQWVEANPVLSLGEPGYESDTGKEKRGDGVSPWTSLDYFLPGGHDTGALQKSANLADLMDVAEARANIELGTAATKDTGTAEGNVPLLSTGGLLPIAQVASGTPNGKKFVRDDGTLVVPLSIPAGGTAGQLLEKASATDGDAVWSAKAQVPTFRGAFTPNPATPYIINDTVFFLNNIWSCQADGTTNQPDSSTPASWLANAMQDVPSLFTRFNSTSGVYSDSSGNSRDVAPYVTPTITRGVPGLLAGDSNLAVLNTGGTGIASLASAAWMNTPTAAFVVRVKPSVIGGAVFWDRDNEATRIYQFGMNASGRPYVTFWLAAGGLYTVLGASTLVADSTYTIGFSYDGATAKIFVNGVLDGTLAQAGALQTGSCGIVFGAHGAVDGSAGSVFKGVLDEALIFPRSILDARFASLHSSAITGPSKWALLTKTPLLLESGASVPATTPVGTLIFEKG